MLADNTSSFTFASVVVTAPIGPHGELTYRIPEAHQTSLKPGMRVLVPVGRRKMTGIVSGVSTFQNTVDEKRLKYILDILDKIPVFPQDLMDLWQWTATYYLTSLGEMLTTILPGGLRSESMRVVMLSKKAKGKRQKAKGKSNKSADDQDVNDQDIAGEQHASTAPSVPNLSAAEQTLLDLVTEKKRISTKALGQRFPTFPLSKILLRLEALDLLQVREYLPQRREMSPEEDLVSSPSPGASAADAPGDTTAFPFALSDAQAAACKHITSALQPPRFEVFLLHGVTGSGKTEVYVQAAQATLLSGKSVLMLVPEIALTHQLVARARQRFGSQVAVLHSGLRAGERWTEWQRIARGEAPVIIGARSAIFAPITRLGLIIVDEEHDGAYKQEEGVRYNARDIAVVRGKISACPVVLGSATPSLESYVHSQSQRYSLLTLPERIALRPLPEVEVIDLRREARADKSDNVGRIFSAALRQALEENHAAGMQSLLFMNRRGYANYLQCRLCGEVLACQQCSVTLTWHLQDGLLRCHYCGFSRRAPERCPACPGTKLEGSGIGTEQVEEALRRLLPTVRVARLDRDSVRKRGALNEILTAWHAHELDVLIGTQMVAKGHDVPGVTLVGVLLADISLNLPDFRAAERTFQLLTQVAGRAGRGNDPGRVIIQTYSPQHYSIRAAVRHDFTRFATQELRYRKQLAYPPFARAVNIRFEGSDGDKVCAYAEQFAEKLHAAIGAEQTAKGSPGSAVVLGPAPAPIEKIKGRERWHLLLKGEQPRALHALIQQTRQELFAHQVRGIRTIVDVDPYSML